MSRRLIEQGRFHNLVPEKRHVTEWHFSARLRLAERVAKPRQDGVKPFVQFFDRLGFQFFPVVARRDFSEVGHRFRAAGEF